MKFDVIMANPPYQDSVNKKKTQHKLWIDFTQASFDKWLKDRGVLAQVSPSSFSSPSNKILKIFQNKNCVYLRLDTKKHFPDVGSTFADYLIVNEPHNGPTEITTPIETFHRNIDKLVFYLPIDICEHSLSIHKKVIFDTTNKLDVRYDYVTCHNVQIHRNDNLSKVETKKHIHPILHTNLQVWYSCLRQDWANEKKVMWSRSGYFIPFYDDGVLGGTDLAYYVLVDDKGSGANLVHNMDSILIKYILKTAKWSGFGNEKVFCALPSLPTYAKLTDDEMFDMFDLSTDERDYVTKIMG